MGFGVQLHGFESNPSDFATVTLEETTLTSWDLLVSFDKMGVTCLFSSGLMRNK